MVSLPSEATQTFKREIKGEFKRKTLKLEIIDIKVPDSQLPEDSGWAEDLHRASFLPRHWLEPAGT